MSKKLQSMALPVLAVLSGLLLGAIIMLVFGYDPIWGYEELFYSAFGSVKSIGEIFRAMAPLILPPSVLLLQAELASLMSVFLAKPWSAGSLPAGLPWPILTCRVLSSLSQPL